MESSTLPDEKVIAATGDIVAVASHVDNDHKAVDTVENGVKVKRCSIYPNLSCEDHVRTSEVGKKYITGRFAAPVSIWCDASGKEMHRKYGFRQPDAFLEDIKAAVAKVPGTRIAKADYDRQAVPFDEAEAAMGDGRYGVALAGYGAAAKGSIEIFKKGAERGLADVKRLGLSLLDKGRKALKTSRQKEARELLEMVAREFAALDCGREAAELLKSGGVEEKDKK